MAKPKSIFRKICLCIATGAVSLCAVWAQENKVTFDVVTDICVVEVCSDNILKIDYRPYGKVSPNTPVVDPRTWNGPSGGTFSDNGASVEITTDKFRAVISKVPFRATIYDAEGRELVANTKPLQGNLFFHHNRDDNFYGLSGYNRDSYEDYHYPLTRNAGGVIEAMPQGGCGAPFIWSTSGYGIVLDTDGGNVSNVNGLLTFGGCSKENYEYYIVVGTPKEIIHGAGEIAGMPQLFPKWNTGFGQLEWGIDEEEFKTHVQGYRERKIPFDWFMLDFDWMAWGEDDYGELRWGSKFPGGATGQLAKWADNAGVKMTAITKPRIIAKKADGSFTAQGRYAEEHGFWYPGEDYFGDYVTRLPSKDLDFSIEACQKWWWSHLRDGAFRKGMVGFLNDECDDSNLGSLYSLGNLSNIFMQKSIYEGQREITDLRVWSINRTAYMGSQKYAYSIWSGDNYPTFADLRSQAVKMLTANNVLVPVWGFCITAFWNTSPVTEELYIRSMQLGMFSPLFFVHGIENQQKQPWFFGRHVTDTSREIINLRYRLIPYMYSYDRVKHETMLGISRALVVEYPEDPEVADISDTFMFGEWLLASPVLDSAATHKRVYLPEGEWIDYFSGKKFGGGRYHMVQTDNKTFTDIPLYIRQGAIIPTQDVMAYVGEKDVATIYMDMFPSRETTSFPLYDDDGTTYRYEKGEYFKQNISLLDSNGRITVNLHDAEGTYKPTFGEYILRVNGTHAPAVTVEGKKLRKFDSESALKKSKQEGYYLTEGTYGPVTVIRTAVSPGAKEIVLTK